MLFSFSKLNQDFNCFSFPSYIVFHFSSRNRFIISFPKRSRRNSITHKYCNRCVEAEGVQRRCVKAESITHKYCNSSTKPKFYKNTRLIGKIIEKTSLANFYSKTHITIIINPSIKSIYKNRISPTPFRKRNNKLIST